MTKNELAKQQNVTDFKKLLNDKTIRAQVKNSLKENSGAFMSSMLDLYSGDDYLQSCEPRAVAMECLKAASLKLPLVKSLGFAYVVPYKNVPTFTIGYKGLIQLAQRSQEYKTINADVVYEGEFVNKDKLSGMIDLSGEKTSDKVVGYFAYFMLTSGFEKTLYMSKEDAEEWATKYSAAYKRGLNDKSKRRTPWWEDFDKMAIKTTLRRLIGTYGPMSNELAKAFESESSVDRVDKEIEQNANKKPLNFDDIEDAEIVEDNKKAETTEPSPEEQQAIIEAEFAEAGEELPPFDA